VVIVSLAVVAAPGAVPQRRPCSFGRPGGVQTWPKLSGWRSTSTPARFERHRVDLHGTRPARAVPGVLQRIGVAAVELDLLGELEPDAVEVGEPGEGVRVERDDHVEELDALSAGILDFDRAGGARGRAEEAATDLRNPAGEVDGCPAPGR